MSTTTRRTSIPRSVPGSLKRGLFKGIVDIQAAISCSPSPLGRRQRGAREPRSTPSQQSQAQQWRPRPKTLPKNYGAETSRPKGIFPVLCSKCHHGTCCRRALPLINCCQAAPARWICAEMAEIMPAQMVATFVMRPRGLSYRSILSATITVVLCGVFWLILDAAKVLAGSNIAIGLSAFFVVAAIAGAALTRPRHRQR